MKIILDNLNEVQREAVTTDKKRMLILAGAGSGKTRVITTRIAYLIKEKGVSPFSILAVTFTNKAAGEMKERVNSLLGEDAKVMIKTFHSFGASVLRAYSFAVGRSSSFQIYDDSDSKKVVDEILKKENIDKSYGKMILRNIKLYKRNGETQKDYFSQIYDFDKIYSAYTKKLEEYNSFDFEDLLLQPVKIFTNFPDILAKYQNRFKHILIDEYQDTNLLQYELVKILCTKDNNLMVVGDEDQSIYGFRGANIENILNFQNDFKDAVVIKLEQNYRSTGNILKAANSVIKNNLNRLGKNLYTEEGEGEYIKLFEAYSDLGEAETILNFIIDNNLSFEDTAIIYRTNSQSRSFEQIFNKHGIPYTIIGALKYFDREEIKDALSVLKWIVNPQDRIAFSRFINKPPRGLGVKTLEAFYKIIDESGKNTMEVLQNISQYKNLSVRGRESLFNIAKIFKNIDEEIETKPIVLLLKQLLTDLNILDYYQIRDAKDGTDKISNLQELISSLNNRGRGREDILNYLEEVGLYANPNNTEEDNDKGTIKLLTAHNAKGLEFENVFLAGMEEGLFPHANSFEEQGDYDEERRLFYVAITRAKKRLFISFCKERYYFGGYQEQYPSQFLSELPKDVIENSYF